MNTLRHDLPIYCLTI